MNCLLWGPKEAATIDIDIRPRFDGEDGDHGANGASTERR